MEKKCKNLIPLMLCIVVFMTMLPSTAFANEASPEDTDVVPVFDNAGEAFEAKLEQEVQPKMPFFDWFSLAPVFIRSGKTKKVHVYLDFKSDNETGNAVKVTNFEIWNTDLIHRKQLYPTFSVGTKTFIANKSARIPLRVNNYIELPVSVKQVRVDVGTYQVFFTKGGWISASDPVGIFYFN